MLRSAFFLSFIPFFTYCKWSKHVLDKKQIRYLLGPYCLCRQFKKEPSSRIASVLCNEDEWRQIHTAHMVCMQRHFDLRLNDGNRKSIVIYKVQLRLLKRILCNELQESPVSSAHECGLVPRVPWERNWQKAWIEIDRVWIQRVKLGRVTRNGNALRLPSRALESRYPMCYSLLKY